MKNNDTLSLSLLSKHVRRVSGAAVGAAGQWLAAGRLAAAALGHRGPQLLLCKTALSLFLCWMLGTPAGPGLAPPRRWGCMCVVQLASQEEQ